MDGAIAEYRAAIDLAPGYAHAHYNLGLALHSNKDLDGAEFRTAIDLDPTDAPGYSSLGLVLRDKKDLNGAIAALRTARNLDPKDAATHYNLANVLRANNDTGEAIVEYRKALDLDAKLAQADYTLGNALRDEGDLGGAAAAYREALKIDPDNPEAHCNLGHALRDHGHSVEALDELRRGDAQGRRRPGWKYRSADWVREAEQFVELDGKLPAILRAEAEPAGPGERLALGSFCGPHKRLHATAARFYAAAFAADPDLAADLGAQHRCNAACSAALAAAGQGEDAKRLPDKARLMLRRQALAWLRDDLAAYQKLAGRAEPAARQSVRQNTQPWQRDTDLTSVHDPQALDRLPDDERQRWHQLWEEVAILLKKV